MKDEDKKTERVKRKLIGFVSGEKGSISKAKALAVGASLAGVAGISQEVAGDIIQDGGSYEDASDYTEHEDYNDGGMYEDGWVEDGNGWNEMYPHSDDHSDYSEYSDHSDHSDYTDHADHSDNSAPTVEKVE